MHTAGSSPTRPSKRWMRKRSPASHSYVSTAVIFAAGPTRLWSCWPFVSHLPENTFRCSRLVLIMVGSRWYSMRCPNCMPEMERHLVPGGVPPPSGRRRRLDADALEDLRRVLTVRFHQ